MRHESITRYARALARRTAAERGRAANAGDHPAADDLTLELEALMALLAAHEAEAEQPPPAVSVWPRGARPLGQDEAGMSSEDWARVRPDYPELVQRARERAIELGRLPPVGALRGGTLSPVASLEGPSPSREGAPSFDSAS